ncbi:cytochrome P450 704C1-like [Arachis duranensis]|uniref:Cytochrome P450 704C1-like n=1 Tax=Arachis duranensis TaxID=130453 RepID=A0A6P4DC90_ARADU|nr:cytochrome P450 704C1-like [Arachis duranensis]
MRFLNFHSEPVSAAVALVATIALIFFALQTSFKRFHSRKGKQHVIGGTVLDQFFNFHRLHDFMTDHATKHKTYRLLSLFRNEVYTADPVNVEYILKTNFANYGKGWYHHGILTDLLGDGIFTVDGEKWQHQRKVATQEISTKAVKDFSLQVFQSNAVTLARVVSEAAISNKAIDFQDLFMKATLDQVFKIIIGVDLDTMCGTYEEGTKFSNAFDEASGLTLYRYVDILWKIKRFLNIGSEAVLRNQIKVVDEFVYELISKRTEQIQKPQHDSHMIKADLVSRFLALEETDPKYLRDIILSFIIAGRDTTAVTLSWFLYLLCKNPHVQEKIAQEVRDTTKLKNTCNIDEITNALTEGTLQKMNYLHAALTETLRLYPAVPVDGKLCLSDETLPDGFSVKRGDMVSYLPYAMGRMEFLWGNDAEEFRPERWLDQNGAFQQQSSFKFTAFQAGPRICLGKDFAYRQMKVFAAVLCHGYKFKLAFKNEEVNYIVMLTLHIDGGLHVHASHR